MQQGELVRGPGVGVTVAILESVEPLASLVGAVHDVAVADDRRVQSVAARVLGYNARYRGVDKNVIGLCRYAVVENLFAADRALRQAA